MEILIEGKKLEYKRYSASLIPGAIRMIQGKPKTIVFLHGFAVAYQNHEDMLHMLNTKGYNVYAINLPGHGRSDLDVKLSLESVVALVKDFILGLNLDEIFLIGYSFGGLVSLKLLEDESISSKVSRATLIAPLTYPLKIKPGYLEMNFGKKSADVLVKTGLGAYQKKIIYSNIALLGPIYRNAAYDFELNLTKNTVPLRILWLGDDEIIDSDQLKQDVKHFGNCELLAVPGYQHDIFNQPTDKLEDLLGIIVE